MVCSPPGSSLHGISQARILEWVVISTPGYLPNPGSPALAGGFFTTEPPGKTYIFIYIYVYILIFVTCYKYRYLAYMRDVYERLIIMNI